MAKSRSVLRVVSVKTLSDGAIRFPSYSVLGGDVSIDFFSLMSSCRLLCSSSVMERNTWRRAWSLRFVAPAVYY